MIIGHPYDGRIDIWSIGAIAAEMLTGKQLIEYCIWILYMDIVIGRLPLYRNVILYGYGHI